MNRERLTGWLRSHAAGERGFKSALRKYFAGQADRVAEALSDFDQVSPSVVPLIFREADEAERLKPIIHEQMLRAMALGASDELAGASKSITADLFSPLPPITQARVLEALRELEQQPYWQAIQAETSQRLIDLIAIGLDEELSNYSIGMQIREFLGGMPANKRAQRIARSEVTGAMNAGHVASMESLAADGLITGKQWLAITDEDVRAEHLAANMQTVKFAESFNVGGFDAPYPGHWGLPAGQRINCRCVVLSVLSDET